MPISSLPSQRKTEIFSVNVPSSEGNSKCPATLECSVKKQVLESLHVLRCLLASPRICKDLLLWSGADENLPVLPSSSVVLGNTFRYHQRKTLMYHWTFQNITDYSQFTLTTFKYHWFANIIPLGSSKALSSARSTPASKPKFRIRYITFANFTQFLRRVRFSFHQGRVRRVKRGVSHTYILLDNLVASFCCWTLALLLHSTLPNIYSHTEPTWQFSLETCCHPSCFCSRWFLPKVEMGRNFKANYFPLIECSPWSPRDLQSESLSELQRTKMISTTCCDSAGALRHQVKYHNKPRGKVVYGWRHIKEYSSAIFMEANFGRLTCTQPAHI